jgi:hypothetical protein
LIAPRNLIGINKGVEMTMAATNPGKKSYVRPVLARREKLGAVAAAPVPVSSGGAA